MGITWYMSAFFMLLNTSVTHKLAEAYQRRLLAPPKSKAGTSRKRCSEYLAL